MIRRSALTRYRVTRIRKFAGSKRTTEDKIIVGSKRRNGLFRLSRATCNFHSGLRRSNGRTKTSCPASVPSVPQPCDCFLKLLKLLKSAWWSRLFLSASVWLPSGSRGYRRVSSFVECSPCSRTCSSNAFSVYRILEMNRFTEDILYFRQWKSSADKKELFR